MSPQQEEPDAEGSPPRGICRWAVIHPTQTFPAEVAVAHESASGKPDLLSKKQQFGSGLRTCPEAK